MALKITAAKRSGTIKDAKHSLQGTPPRRARGRVFLYVVLLLGVLAVLQEVLFRFLFPLPEVMSFGRINYTPLNLFGAQVQAAGRWGLGNTIIRWESEPDGFSFDHKLNVYGFRGPDFALEPTRDRPRVLFIGDSMVEGFGAADDDTIPAQFARLASGMRPSEAINLGVGATGLPEYARLVRDGVHLLRPQAVFLVVFANDLPAARFPRYTLPYFSTVNPYLPRIAQVVGCLKKQHAPPRFFQSGPYPFIEPVPSVNNPLTKGPPPENIDPAILDAMRRGKCNPWIARAGDFYENALSRDYSREGGAGDYLEYIRSICQQHQAALTVVYIPYHAAVNPLYISAQNKLGGRGLGALTSLDAPRFRGQQAHLREATRNLDVPFLDTTEAFIEAEKTRGRMFWAVDGHCNASGYGLVAETCAGFWTGSILPGPNSSALLETENQQTGN